MPVGELLARTSSAELTEWIAYERITGTLGAERDDMHAGIVASTVVNVNRKKGKPPVPPSKFIPRWDRAPMSWQQQLAIVKAMNASMGGQDQTRG